MSALVVQPPSPTHVHIPRPPNAFILFRAATQSQLGLSSKPQGRRSVDIAELWKHLDEEEKTSWYRKAEMAKIEHSKAYPGWKYQPAKKVEGANKRRGKGKGEKIKGMVLGESRRSPVDVTHVRPRVGLRPHSAGLDERERLGGCTDNSELAAIIEVESNRNCQWLYYRPELEGTNSGPWSIRPPLPSIPATSEEEEAQLPFQLRVVEPELTLPLPSTPDFDFYSSQTSCTGLQSSSVASVKLGTQAQVHAQTLIPDPSVVVDITDMDVDLNYEVTCQWGALDWLKCIDQVLWSDEEKDLVRSHYTSYPSDST